MFRKLHMLPISLIVRSDLPRRIAETHLRPKALNALNLEMVRLIDPAVRVWDADPEVAVITMVGTGEKAFCAGGDVVAVANSGRGGPGSDGGVFARDFFREEYVLDHCLARLSKPYVAFIDGITMGGGVGLSMPADFRVATERTLFAMPETGTPIYSRRQVNDIWVCGCVDGRENHLNTSGPKPTPPPNFGMNRGLAMRCELLR